MLGATVVPEYFFAVAMVSRYGTEAKNNSVPSIDQSL